MKDLQILLLEDQSIDADLILTLLRRSEFEFRHKIVNERKKFTKTLSSFRPDIILSDFNLPDFDGFEALQIAKKLTPGIPFIIVSGAIGEEMAVDLMKKGATDFVLKDNLTRLPLVVRRAVREAEERRVRLEVEGRLEAVNKELETFMYKASHSLKGPTTTIRGILNLANQNITDGEGAEFLEMMAKSLGKLENTLEELIRVTLIRQGIISITKVDLADVIDEVISKAERLPNYQYVNFNYNIGDNIDFHSDSDLVTTIIEKIVENSINYVKEDKSAFVNVDIDSNNEDLKIEITDNSAGIPKDLHSKVFEMFYRGTQRSPGAGLGLYIVKSATQALGGKIELESEEKIGTKVIVNLPMKSELAEMNGS